jgi:hypothetical protein
MGWDRAKAVTWKGKEKGKEDSSSHSESSFTVDDTMSTLKRLSNSFAKLTVEAVKQT